MAEVIIMPKLGFNMDEGQLIKWSKKVGDKVSKGEVLFEINTDKTNMPVEAVSDGVLLKTTINEGDVVKVFTPIAIVGEEGEDAEAILNDYLVENGLEVAEAKIEEKSISDKPEALAEDINYGDVKLTPKAKKYIKDEEIDIDSLKAVKGTGYKGGITAKDIKVSPLARKIADKAGIDLQSISGSGVNDKIMKTDVERNIAASLVGTVEKKILKETPYQGVRRIIGERLSESKFASPHVYFTDSIDTTNLTDFRKSLNELAEEKTSVTDLLVLAASKALQKYPDMNIALMNETVVTYKSTNIGVAVAGNNGLIVPVVKNVQEKSLTNISQETKSLIAKAKDGQLIPQEYSEGTFTISNLGMFGIENFSAIINPPESAILAVSSVRKKAVVVEIDGEDKVEIRPMMNIQLSVDHRVIDGLLAAQFVGYLKNLLENPIKILM